MRFIKTKEQGLEDNYLELHYEKIDEETKEYITMIDKALAHIEGISEEVKIIVPVSDVIYFESVDRKTFAYTDDKTIELREPLKNLLNSFGDIGFIRISKSVVVNVYKIKHLQGVI